MVKAQFNFPITTPTWYKKVRVDSVFWLNTVDTVHNYAVLYPGALMSRTTGGDTSLYLANGQRWVRIGSAVAGGGTIDSAWRSNDTLYFRYASGGSLGVKMDYYTMSQSDARYPPNARQINTTSPLSGGGNLSADRTLSIANAQADGENKGAATFRSDHFDDDTQGAISLDTVNGPYYTKTQSVAGFIQNQSSAAQSANFWITGNGRINNKLAVGPIDPLFGAHVSGNPGVVVIQSTGAYSSTSGGLLELYNSGLPSAANQRLSALVFGAMPTNSTIAPSAQIDAVSSGAWVNGSDHGTHLRFYTTPVGTPTITERMRIADDGNVGIGTTNTSNAKLTVNGTIQNSAAAANNQAVTLGQLKDSVYKRLPGKIISTVAQLGSYGPTDSLIYVTEQYRGGFFQWQSSGSADGGVYFAGTSGIWKRHFNRANGINVRWYGPAADGTTNDVTKIQAAVDRAAADSVITVYMNNMTLDIGSTITVPSNITINAYGSYIELIPGSSCDMIRNADLTNGNRNIKVLGGTWNGRGWTQTRTIAGTVAASSFCFGMFFYRCENVEVGHLEIDSTRSWGISAMEANRIYVHDIKFQQNPYKPDGSVGLAENGDGFTFNANNVTAERISGFTNDDMVAAAAGGAIFSGSQTPFLQLNYENIVIKDIFPNTINDSIPTWRAVGIYVFNNKRLTNVSVSNINGVTCAGKVIISNALGDSFGGGLGFFDNIILENINGKSRSVAGFSATQFGIISIAAADVNKLIVTGGNRSDSLNTSHIKTTDSTIIRELNVSNINIQSVGQLVRLIDDGAKIRSINISNVNLYDSLGVVGQRLYDRASSPFNTDTVFIKASNTHITRPTGFSTISIGSGKVSFSSTSVVVADTTSFSPVEGNVMVTENLGLVNYKSGRWVGIGVGYINTYSASSLTFNTNNTERGRFDGSVGTFILGPNSGERLSARFNGLAFNRNVSTGAIFNTGFAHQFSHTANASAASDFLTLMTYNNAGSAVKTATLTVNGNGDIGIGKNTQTSTLDVAGSTAHSNVTVTGNTTLDGTHYTVLVNNIGSVTITLPAASGCSGRVYVIKKVSAASNDVVIDPNGSELIDGTSTSKTLTLQWSSVMIQSNGTSWFVLSSHAAATTL